MSKDSDSIVDASKNKRKLKKKKTPELLLPSGSTQLNLACTNTPFGAFPAGKYVFIVGDSTSGKTFVSMSCFAEAVMHPVFKDYRLIYDNVEDGMLMDLEALFNKKVAKTVEPPRFDTDGSPLHSFTIEHFYFNLDDAIKDGRPFIYVLDSMDGLDSDYAQEKFEAHKRLHEGKGKKGDEAGSYGDGKAKKNSEGIRRTLKGLRETNSILIIISQTRDNLGFGMDKKTRSGGKALKFYATLEIWTAPGGDIQKTVRKKKRNVGIHALVNIKKNRITGEEHKTAMDIYPSYGIDDIGSCIDYLISESWWDKKGNNIDADDFEFVGTREKLIAHIEEEDLHRQLQRITGKCWNEIREASKLKRKKKYEEED
jgi:RecA/RadA recombinase